MLSWIQKSALYVLLRNQYATVQEMKPEGVEANLFAYHLEGLQADGYIEKVRRGTYTLTTKGQRFVGALSTNTGKASEFIKTVVMLYGKAADGRYLLFRWSRQPYIGKVGLLHDHMPLGKSLKDGIESAMQDKLDVILEPAYLATVLVKIEHEGDLVSHMNALVYKVDVDGLMLPFESRNGTAFLGNPSTLDDAMLGLPEFVESLESSVEPREVLLTY